MSCDPEKCRLMIENLPDAFAYYQVVTDENGNPLDFICIQANVAFEEVTGLKRTEVIGKKVTEVLPAGGTANFDWIGTYRKVSLTGKAVRSESYSEPLKRWYEVCAYSDEPGCFALVFRDISVQKEQALELQQSQKSLKHLANNIPDMVARFDTNLRHIYVNQAARQTLGIPAEIFIGHSFMDLCNLSIPPELVNQLQAMHSALEKCLLSGEEQHFVDCFTLPDGEKHLLTRIVPEKVKGGKIVSLLAITTNITGLIYEKKRNSAIAELLLGLNEQGNVNDALRLCLDTALSVTAFDCGGIYLFDENSGALKLAVHRGLSELFLTIVSLVEPDNPRMSLIMSGQPIYTEYTNLNTPLDETRQHEGLQSIAIVPIFYSQNLIACFNVASHTNNAIPENDKKALESISAQIGSFLARLMAEEALREGEAQFRQITENMIDVVWLLSADNSKMIYVSPSYEQTWGRTCQSLYDNPQAFIESVFSEDLDKVRAEFDRYLKRGKFDLEYRIKRPDDQLRWLRARSYPVRNSSGEVIRHAGIATDITEHKRDEAELHALHHKLEERVKERTAQLEAANRELDAFSHSASHDLRGPLNRISGFSHALLEDYSDRLDSQGIDYLQRINNSCERMKMLINDLLALSRVSQKEINREPVELSALVNVYLKELQAREPHQQVETVITSGLIVKADTALIRIVLENLLDNAWKFTAGSENARIEFGSMLYEDKEAYFIRDNGVGFDMKHAEKLFTAFQRLHDAQKYPGTGIGLSIVLRIIKRHGGEIWAEGEEGKGATFFFTLP